MRTLFSAFSIILLLSVLSCSPLRKYKHSVQGWENDIRKFEQQDSTQKYPDDAILFMGSSSIRLWNTLPEDMKPYPVIQRGFGGSKISDVAWYTPRIVYPHKVKAVVLFVANDINGSPDDKTPEEVASLFRYVVKSIRKKHPGVPVFYIQVTPTESRWKVWPQIQEGNRLIQQLSKTMKKVYFVETEKAFLNSDGKPNSALFLDDKLHLNAQGYQVWTRIIKQNLDEVLQ